MTGPDDHATVPEIERRGRAAAAALGVEVADVAPYLAPGDSFGSSGPSS